MSASMDPYSVIIQQTKSSRLKHVLKALLDIRKSYIKSPTGVQKLVGGGLVQRLLELIHTREQLDKDYSMKIVDMAVSVLSNMCMEDCTRQKVLQVRGFLIIETLFLTAKTDSLNNRACRCLANILQSSQTWSLVQTSQVAEKIITLFKDNDNIEHLQTYIRALRLLGKTGSHVKKLLEKNVVCVIAKFLDHDEDAVANAALKCLLSLSSHLCPVQFASQVSSSGKISTLIALIEAYNEDAFRLTVRLCDHHHFRPEFGNAGGMKLFKSMLQEYDETLNTRSKTDKTCLTYDLRKGADHGENDDSKDVSPAGSNKDTDQSKSKVDSINKDVSKAKKSMTQKTVEGPKDGIQVSEIHKLKTDDNKSIDQKADYISTFEKNSKSGNTEQNSKNGEVVQMSDKMLKIESWQLDLISVLSLCCKEVVNRVKLREDETLVLLVGAFRNSKLTKIHERLLSAFLCFLYDEAGFQMLVRNKLIDALVTHLKTYIIPDVKRGGTKIKMSIWSRSKAKGEHVKSENTTVEKAGDQKLAIEDGTKLCDGADQIKGKSNQTTNRQQENLIDSSEDVDTGVEDKELVETPSKRSKPVYSINSPSYILQTEWQECDGNKCIETFSPVRNTGQNISKSYSPFSDTSYYSPSESGSDYSPNRSPLNSPDYQQNFKRETSKRNLYMYSSCGSDSDSETMAGSSSDFGSPIMSIADLMELPDTLEYSPVVSPAPGNIEQDHDVDKNDSDETVGMDSIVKRKVFDLDSENKRGTCGKTVCEVKDTTGEISESGEVEGNHETSKHDFKSTMISDTKDHDIQKVDSHVFDDSVYQLDPDFEENMATCNEAKRILDCVTSETTFEPVHKITCQFTYTENSLLILLSRVSQMTDPTGHLVNLDTMVSLLDYLRRVDRPLARCSRLLSRIFRNPNCFQKLLTLNIPMLIYLKLLEHADVPSLVKDLKKKNKGKLKRIRTMSESSETDFDSDRFSITSDASETSEQPYKRHRTDSGIDSRRSSSTDYHHLQREDICDAALSGLAFLEDLSYIADSSYGNGSVERLLLNKDISLQLSINMLYISWSRGAREHYFRRGVILGYIMDALYDWKTLPVDQFIDIIRGIRCLSQILNVWEKYGPMEEPVKEPDDLLESGDLLGPVDFFATEECAVDGRRLIRRDKVTFVVDDERIDASKSVLVEKSEIFTAMLEGHYSEAGLSEITIKGSSSFAFRYLIHYLHGCDGGDSKCSVINELDAMPKTNENAKKVVLLVTEADKYLIPSLKEKACEVLFNVYTTPATASSIFRFAVLHRKLDLMKACVAAIFSQSDHLQETVEYALELLQGKFCDIFLHTLSEILVE